MKMTIRKSLSWLSTEAWLAGQDDRTVDLIDLDPQVGGEEGGGQDEADGEDGGGRHGGDRGQ